MTTALPRVLLISYGSAGDLYPFLALAQALQARGLDPLLLTGATHAPAIARAGVRWQAVGDPAAYQRALADPDLWHPRRGIRVLLREFGAQMAPLCEVIQAQLPAGTPALVLSHPFGLPALDLLRAVRPRMRVAGVHLAPASLRSVGEPMVWGPLRVPRWVGPGLRQRLWAWSDRRLVDPWGLPQINPLRAQHGLAPVPHFLPHLYQPADCSLTLFPPWFAPTQPDWHGPVVTGGFPLFDPHDGDDAAGPAALDGDDAARHAALDGDDAAGPAALRAFLDAGGGRPAARPLVLTPGSANGHAARLLAAALRAAQALGRRAIVLTPHRDQLPAPLPPGVLWLPYVPLGALLPHAALLLHHGGIGTSAQALRAGVPQLVVPHGWDQFDNAERLIRLGVARRCPVWRARSGPLRRAMQALLSDPAVAAACARAAQLAAQGPDIATVVQRLLAQAAPQLGLDPELPTAPALAVAG